LEGKGKNMKIGMADVLEPATTEGGLAVEAFIKICPPADISNFDEEWLQMCAFFVKGWLAKSAQHRIHRTSDSRKDTKCEPAPEVNAHSLFS
jgi:hypothetical protein